MAGVLYADPPWRFGDKLPGAGRGAERHYSTLSVSEIMRFPLPPLPEDCWLFMWRVHTHQEEAALVMKAWGFEYCSELVWVKLGKNGKPRIGMGRTLRMAHEVCVVGKRGRPQVGWKGFPSVLMAPRDEHSAKPQEMYSLLEQFSPGPYIELFARVRREPWIQFGDQLP